MVEQNTAAPPLSKAQATANVLGRLGEVADRLADENDHDALLDILRAVQKKPAIRSTEFWLSTLLSLVGTALSLGFPAGHEAQGGLMLTASVVFYTLSRTVVKAAEAKAQGAPALASAAPVPAGAPAPAAGEG